MDNAALADRLETFAGLLDLAEANPHSIRAYRRAADGIRGATVPVADFVRAGRARELPGVARGIEGRLRELVETGDIAELVELERELAPGLGSGTPSLRACPELSGPPKVAAIWEKFGQFAAVRSAEFGTSGGT